MAAGHMRAKGLQAFRQSTISLNKAEYGGGVYNDIGTVDIENSTVSGNKATFWGGGIFNDGTMTVTNATITKNTAVFGGGIFNYLRRHDYSQHTLISGNKAPSGFSPEVYNTTGPSLPITSICSGRRTMPGSRMLPLERPT